MSALASVVCMLPHLLIQLIPAPVLPDFEDSIPGVRFLGKTGHNCHY